ncbi:MAG: hypothetical protein KDK60_01615 [Chlamydiia bacterium]|nr:hypothetical protein [Chlamydiia bacterium]
MKFTGNSLQYVIPLGVGVTDVLPQVSKGEWGEAAKKAVKVALFLFFQKMIARFMKWALPGINPSWQLIIGSTFFLRVYHRDYKGKDSPVSSVIVGVATTIIAMRGYAAKKHGVFDFAASILYSRLSAEVLNYAMDD